MIGISAYFLLTATIALGGIFVFVGRAVASRSAEELP
jgi:hypothetical protein